MMNLVIVGTIGLDDVETPFGKVESILGGSAAYASCAASFFAKSGIVSIVGEDMPKTDLAILDKRGVDLAGVVTQGKTFRWGGSYEYDMSSATTLKTELNSLADFNPKLSDEYKKAKFLFLGNIDPSLQLDVISQMENSPFIALDTMNYWISSQREKLIEVIGKVNLVVINEGEARQLFDTPNLIRAGKMLLDLGPDYVVIKKGEHGALLFSKNGFFSAPGYPLETVKDPTGCGDSFAGGLIGYLAQKGTIDDETMRKAVVYGSTIASFCAEDFSLNYLKNINQNEIEERYNEFEEIRRF